MIGHRARTLLHLPELDFVVGIVAHQDHPGAGKAGVNTAPAQYDTSQKFSKAGKLPARNVEPLSAVSVPDRAGRFVIPAFAPNRVGCSFAVNGDAEIIAEGKTKAAGKNIVVAAHRP